MGSQQLFLLILSLLLVGLSIFSGYNFAINYYQEKNRDHLIDKINHLYQDAALYRKKTEELGGGNGSYKNWSFSDRFITADNTEIDFTLTDNVIVFKAIGNVTGWDGENGTKVWIKYSENNGKTIRFLN